VAVLAEVKVIGDTGTSPEGLVSVWDGVKADFSASSRIRTSSIALARDVVTMAMMVEVTPSRKNDKEICCLTNTHACRIWLSERFSATSMLTQVAEQQDSLSTGGINFITIIVVVSAPACRGCGRQSEQKHAQAASSKDSLSTSAPWLRIV
jgi:hypothetical protein